MQSLAKRCSAIGLALATVTSSSVFAEWQLDMTPGVTDISQQVFDMHRTMLWWCVAIGIVVFGAMFYALFAFRKSRGAVAANFHENTTVEVIWTAIPVVILIAMAAPATMSLLALENTAE